MRKELNQAAPSGELSVLQHRLDAIQASFSWRLTAPLRYFLDLCKRLRPRRLC